MLEKIINSIKNLARPLVFAGTLALASAGCYEEYYNNNSGGSSEEFPPEYTWEETQKNPLMHEGVNLTSWWFSDYGQQAVIGALDTLHGLGVESVSILVTQYQDTLDPTQIYANPVKTPTDEGIERVVRKAKSLGMRTVLKPHVDPDDDSWRGYIDFGSNEAAWADWFDTYRTFILDYAQLAEDNEVDMLIIGTELSGTTHRPEWDQIIDDVRAVYSGEITYAANHDNYQAINWWNKLDYIGVDAYFSLTTSTDPSLSDLVDEWNIIAQDLDAFSQAQGKQIMITEVGYQSLDGTNITPWWTSTSTLDEQEQADCYEAMFSNLHNTGSVGGIYLWMTYHDPLQDVNGFDFTGKQSEVTVDYYYHVDG